MGSKMVLNEELDGIEDLIMGILVKFLRQIGYYPDSQKDQTYKTAKLKLDKVKARVLGMVGQIVPSVVRRMFSHPGILPVFREIIAENPLKLIREKKSTFKAGAAKGASWFGLLNPKEKVMSKFNPMFKSGSKQALDTIIQRCRLWASNFKKVDKYGLPKSEYIFGIDRFGEVSKAAAPAPKVTTKRIGVDEIKAAVPDAADGIVDPTQLILDMKVLRRQVFLMQCIIGALAVILLLSWGYIAYSGFRTESSVSGSRRGISKRVSQVDLELGEGPCRVRKSRYSANHLGVSVTSVRPSRHSVRESDSENKLEITMNSVRGYRSQEDVKHSSRHHRSARRSLRRSKNSDSPRDNAAKFLGTVTNSSKESRSRRGRSRRGLRSSRGHYSESRQSCR